MRSIVLVGLMGVGKSSAGSLVAISTGRPFVDVDTAIVERTGKTVRQLWKEGGEGAYRHFESRVVLDTLESHSCSVLAARPGSSSTRTSAPRGRLVRRLVAGEPGHLGQPGRTR